MSDDACDHRFCNPDRCFIRERDAARDQPTIAPPDRSSIANDLRARADRLDQMSLQLVRQALELRDVADRIEGQ